MICDIALITGKNLILSAIKFNLLPGLTHAVIDRRGLSLQFYVTIFLFVHLTLRIKITGINLVPKISQFVKYFVRLTIFVIVLFPAHNF